MKKWPFRSRRQAWRAGLVGGVLLVCAHEPPESRGEPELGRFEYSATHMGAPIKLVLYAPDESAANRAAQAAYDRLAALDACLSDYRSESELSRLSASAGSGRWVPISRDLWLVLTRAQQLAQQTDGAFDVTVGPVVRLWRRARRQKTLPPPDQLEAALARVGHRHLVLDADRRAACLTRDGMRLDLGGIAMGFAADEALAELAERGITRALIDASGDIICGDPPPGARGWRIGIAPPAAEAPAERFVTLARAAITTSGDAYQYLEFGGTRYSHIVDPKTGLGLTTPMGVTVIARDGITADSLATAASVLGPERGLALVEAADGAAAWIVVNRNGRIASFASQRLEQFALEPAPDE